VALNTEEVQSAPLPPAPTEMAWHGMSSLEHASVVALGPEPQLLEKALDAVNMTGLTGPSRC
jgi:hypothetical protein